MKPAHAVRFWVMMTMAHVSATTLAQTEISSIDFKVDGNDSIIEIVSKGPLSYDQKDNAQDQQIILNISDAKLGATASRKLDTS